MKRAFWSAVLIGALYWPGRTLSAMDGLPLNGVAEAIVLGLAVPFLWIVDRRFLDRRSVRFVVVILLGVKLIDVLCLTQEGLCARFATDGPFRTEVLTIPAEEPTGALRSWDVRADWRAQAPSCTAIIDRPYVAQEAFPAWFLNLISGTATGTDGARRTPVRMDVRGALTLDAPAKFGVVVGTGSTLAGTIGHVPIAWPADRDALMLADGVHRIELKIELPDRQWRFEPTVNGRDAFATARLTVSPPSAFEGRLASVVRNATPALVAMLVAAWAVSFVMAQQIGTPLLVWTIAVAVLMCVAAGQPLERFAAIALVIGAVVPAPQQKRGWRLVMLMVGVPWLAFFAARSLPLIGHISTYSNGDDWLAYQIAGYRIFMNGSWLEGGSRTFDYQPLYRWISGALHLVFGDSSVGELYWDAGCLLAAALMSYTAVVRVAGPRFASVAAAATLATFCAATTWYFPGRGLAEISAAGFASLTAVSLLTAARYGIAASATAGVLAVLMFYTRLNHLLLAPALAALLLPSAQPSTSIRERTLLRSMNSRAVGAYLVTFSTGVLLFALRTWWYTGVFSVIYGTSLKNNDTGLRLSTIASADVWRHVGHSLGALVWMNEPPRPDVRASLVAAGVGLAALALLQVPRVSRLPLGVVLATLACCLGSLFAHTHNYPGRMSIHLVPFAVAVTIVFTHDIISFPRRQHARPIPQNMPA